jgi:hypothetical protein
MPHQLDDVSSALGQIRRESLDIYNRLHSIEEDINFVNLVHDIYADLPLIREDASFQRIPADIDPDKRIYGVVPGTLTPPS